MNYHKECYNFKVRAVMFALVSGLNHLMQKHQGRKDTLQSYGFGLLFLLLLVFVFFFGCWETILIIIGNYTPHLVGLESAISSSTLLLQEKEVTFEIELIGSYGFCFKNKFLQSNYYQSGAAATSNFVAYECVLSFLSCFRNVWMT